jgi:hypothetical protein
VRPRLGPVDLINMLVEVATSRTLTLRPHRSGQCVRERRGVELGLRFQLALFEQAQAFAYDLAGVAVAAAAK